MQDPVLEFWNNKQVKTASWYDFNFQLHRNDGEPSKIGFFKTGERSYEEWYSEGQLHRDEGPAIIHYWKNGYAMVEFHFNNGKLHRIGAPAEIWFYPNGTILDTKWFLSGEEISSIDDDVIWFPRDYLTQS